MIEITLDTAIAALKGAVDEKGADFVYRPQDYDGFESCYYVHSDHEGPEHREMMEFEDLKNVVPGCIVGNALHRLGVPLRDMIKFEGDPARQLLDGLADNDMITLAEDEVDSVFRIAQSMQDVGNNWGLAYEKALIRYNIAKKSS